MKTSPKDRSSSVILLFLLFYIAAFMLSFAAGRYRIDPLTLIKILLSRIVPLKHTWTEQAEIIVFNIRIPRIAAASLIGSSLALSGLVFQTLFHNPMVSPDVLGTTGGAGFGAALALLMNMPLYGVSIMAFISGMISMAFVYLISSRIKNNQVLGLILGGIMVGSLFSSGTSFIKLVADPNDTLPNITYFLMGSIAGCRISDVKLVAIPMIAGIMLIYSMSWRISILSLSDEESRSLGVRTKALRLILVSASAMLISSSVAIAGVIGWIGLVIPHIVRMIMGCDTRRTIPASVILGAAFLVLVDTVSRILSTTEVPIGILTSVIGAPFFLYLIIRQGRREDAA